MKDFGKGGQSGIGYCGVGCWVLPPCSPIVILSECEGSLIPRPGL